MKKKYSDPLMFSIGVLSIVELPHTNDSVQGGITAKIGSLFSEGSSSLSISSADENENDAEVQIVEPAQESEATITEEGIQSVIDQILGEETETVPSDESSIAD